MEEGRRLLDFVGLAGRGDLMAKQLPYGDQRRLEIARALAGKPDLVLLDEPAAGMNPTETADLMAFIRRLRDVVGITILLIEHHMQVVMNISDMVTVMDFGEKIAEGTPHEVQKDPAGDRGLPGQRGNRYMALLEANDIHTYYGSIHALKGITLTVEKGEIVTLIGGNGAGKTTTLNTICGVYHPRTGTILLEGEPIQPAASARHRQDAAWPSRRKAGASLAACPSPRTWRWAHSPARTRQASNATWNGSTPSSLA